MVFSCSTFAAESWSVKQPRLSGLWQSVMPNISNQQTDSSEVAYAVPVAVTEPETRNVSKSGLAELLARPALAWIVLSVLTLLTWGPRLLRSFWVDEAGTFWMVYKGPIAA